MQYIILRYSTVKHKNIHNFTLQFSLIQSSVIQSSTVAYKTAPAPNPTLCNCECPANTENCQYVPQVYTVLYNMSP